MTQHATTRRFDTAPGPGARSAGLVSVLALAGLLLASGHLQAQERGHIEGRVLITGSDEPVQDALIELEGRYRMTETDSLGRFRFNSVPTGPYTVVASKDGYSEGSGSVTVRVSEIAEVKIRLDRKDGDEEAAKSRCSASVRTVVTIADRGVRSGPAPARAGLRRARLEEGRRTGAPPLGR